MERVSGSSSACTAPDCSSNPDDEPAWSVAHRLHGAPRSAARAPGRMTTRWMLGSSESSARAPPSTHSTSYACVWAAACDGCALRWNGCSALVAFRSSTRPRPWAASATSGACDRSDRAFVAPQAAAKLSRLRQSLGGLSGADCESLARKSGTSAQSESKALHCDALRKFGPSPLRGGLPASRGHTAKDFVVSSREDTTGDPLGFRSGVKCN